MKADSRDREIEASLVIQAEEPQTIASQIAGLTSIGGYRLLSRYPHRIHDFYFDTPDRDLQTREMALRIREIGEDRWINLKGAPQPIPCGGIERLELEGSWSEDSLKRICKELMDSGIKVPQRYQDFSDARPLDVMADLGLELIQNRRDHREIRNIVCVGQESSPVLAEMAIDSVVYCFSGQKVRHYEVEIEAKTQGPSIVLKKVVESLIAIYGHVLRKWDHSKLVTGKAVEEMLSKGISKELLDINNNLKPVAYDKIDDYLKRSSI